MLRNGRKTHVKMTSGERKSGVDISACKPCLVVLERLTEEEVQNLSAGNHSAIRSRDGHQPGNSTSTKRRSLRRTVPPTRHESRMWKQSRKRKVRKQDNDRSKIDKNNQDHSVVNTQVKKVKDQIYIKETNKSDSECQAINRERANEGIRNFSRLRQEKLGSDNNDKFQDRRKEISRNEDLGNIKNSESNTRYDESKLSALIRLQLSPEKKSSATEIGESGNASSSVSNESGSKDSKPEILQPKRFCLSLKRNTTNLNNKETSGQDFHRKISFPQNSDESCAEQKIQITSLKIKRKMIDTTNAEPSASKLRKRDKKQSSNDEKVDRVQCDRISEEEPSSAVDNRVSNVKDLRVSLVKLELIGNLAAPKQDDSFKALDRYIDVSEKDRDSRSRIVETEPKHQIENSPSKIRSTKITDYFFKVDKITLFNDSYKSSPSKLDKDLVLKEKFGICKDPVVALVDLKQRKTPASECLDSEVKEVTQEPNSSINLNSNSTTTIQPSPSSVSHSNKLATSSSESSRNAEQSPTRVSHSFLADDPTDNELPSVSESLLTHKYPQTQTFLSSKGTEDNSSVNIRTPRSRRDKEASSSTGHIEDQKVSEKDSGTGKSLSTPRPQEPPSPTKPYEVSDQSSKKSTPKSLKIVCSRSLNLTLTPGKQLDLSTDDMGTNKTRSPATDVNRKSPKINLVQDQLDNVAQSSSKVMADCDEPEEKLADTSDVDKNSNTVTDQRVTVIKSPILGRHSSPGIKQRTPRSIPVNSMTFISREMVEDNSSWVDLNRAIDIANVTETTAKDCPVPEEESPENLPNDDTRLEKKKTQKKKLLTSSPTLQLVSQATVKNLSAELSASENIEPSSSGLVHKEIGETQPVDFASEIETSVSSDKILETISTNEDSMNPKISEEVTESCTTVIEYLMSKAAENISPLRSACKNIEPHSSRANTLVQENMGDILSSDSALGTSVPSTGIVTSISSTEDSSEPVLDEDANQDRENSKTQTELRTDQVEGDLFIDIDESDSGVPTAESGVSSNLCTTGASLVDGADEAKEILAKKKCVICKKTFKHMWSLETHLQVHVKITDETCKICDKLIANTDIIQHYLDHCVHMDSDGIENSICYICDQGFKKKSGLRSHLRAKHDIKTKRTRRKKTPKNSERNKCTVCLLYCNSDEDLFTHMRSHIGRELQDAYEVAKAKQLDRQNTIFGLNEAGDTPEKEKTVEEEPVASESTEANNTSKDCEISVCMCHKEERLEISGGVIIELALACIQCKTFFKTSKCFKDHYSSKSCMWSDNTVITPKLFCNKCCVILNGLEELHSHLKKHNEVNVETKTSFLCKRCNMFYFGIGDLFYVHWFEHWNNPLYVADHRAFPHNMRVNIVEPESTEETTTDEPTQSLFIAEHQCHTCQTPFQTKAELKKHLIASKSCSEKVAENPKPCYKLVCSMCNKGYSDKSTFDNHIEEHPDIRNFLHGPENVRTSTDRPLICSFCKTGYDAVKEYEEHLIRHKIMQQKFSCNYCTLMMDSLEDFERHSVEHKGTPEKPVACKVVFAKAKFHCEPCMLRFDNQILLDEHLTTHGNATTSAPNSVEESTSPIVPVIQKKSPIRLPRKQKFDNIVEPDAIVPICDENASGKSAVNPLVIDLSDDSNSTDIEIIEAVGKKQGEEVVVENNSDQKGQKTGDTQETEKPVFLRVKNLKELLPFDCKVCRAEFDTQLNLSKHVCTPIAPAQVSSQAVIPAQASSQTVTPTKDKDFNYFCTICKKYQCDNDADWNLHVLSHFPLQSSPTFSESWFYVLKHPNGQKEYTCNFCGHYKSLTIHTMRHHFIIVHPNIYRPYFKCRVCHNFETEVEQEIRRHESSHFLQPSSALMNLPSSEHNSSSLQSVVNSNSYRQLVSTQTTSSSPSLPQVINNAQQPVQIPPVPSSSNDSSMFQVMRNFTTPQQSGQTLSASASGDIASFLQVLRNFTNSQRMLQPPTLCTLTNNSSSLQPMQNFTTPEQPVQLPSLTSSGNSSSTFQSVQNHSNSHQVRIAPVPSSANNSSILQPTKNSNNQRPPIQHSPVTSSGNASSPLQSVQNLTNAQQLVQLPPVTSSGNSSSLQLAQHFDSTQQPRSIPSLINFSNNLVPSQPLNNSNNFQQPVSTAPAAGSKDNLSSVQQLQNLNIPQQPPLTVNDWNKFQQPSSVPPVISSANNVPSFPPIDNSRWLTTTAGTLQIQINNTSPFNNMTNMVHTVPLYVANVIYCCRICKNFKCSSAQELKAHESQHDVGQMADSSQNSYRCKACPNVFYSSEELLKAHMEIYHNTEQLNVSKGHTQYNTSTTSIKCGNCFLVFESSTQLMQHMNTCPKVPSQQKNNTQYQNVRPYTCHSCSSVFINEVFLRNHIRQMHPDVKLSRPKTSDGKSLYQCVTCGLLLISEETLSYHMKSHSIAHGFQ